MDTRKSPEDYFSQAMQCVISGNLSDLEMLISLQFNIENSATQSNIDIVMANDSDSEYIDEIKEFKTVAEPVFCKEEGEALLLQACDYERYDIAIFLLKLTHLPNTNNPTIRDSTIPVTSIFLKKVLDMFSLKKIINKKNSMLPNLDIPCIADITNIKDIYQHELFLKNLFICFFDQNIANEPLIIRLFHNIKKYFSDQSAALRDTLKHYLKVLCNPMSHRYETPILFENLLLSIPEAKEIIKKDCDLNTNVCSHYQLQIIYKPYITEDEVKEYNTVFHTHIDFIFNLIQTMRKSAAMPSFPFFKKDFSVMLTLENKVLQIQSNGSNSIKRFDSLVRLLIAERDNLKNGYEEIANKINSLLENIFKNELVRTIYSFSNRTNTVLPKLRMNIQNFYTYNFHIDRLPNSLCHLNHKNSNPYS